MRSMQLLHDRLLILSFYRTASALNVFDVKQLLELRQVSEEEAAVAADRQERLLKLPTGVIAFQSNYDHRHSQKLLLYGNVGILCQRLDHSSENLVFLLKSRGTEQRSTQDGASKKVATPLSSTTSFFWKSRLKLK